MKTLVTGGAGMLGKEIVAKLLGQHAVYHPLRCQMDVTQFDQVQDFFRRHKPDVVFHCAAMTNVNGCTLDPDEAYRQNALATANVAKGCKQLGARLIYVSTDYVFDGKRDTPYNEWEEPNPINIYGKSKLAGERLAFQNCTNVIVARTQWLYGDGKCFPNTIAQKLLMGETVQIMPAQYGAPTWTRDLAHLLCQFTNHEVPNGIYHVTAQGTSSWMEIAFLIAHHYKIDTKQIQPYRGGQWDETERPTYSVLDHQMLRMIGRDQMHDWKERLLTYLGEKDSSVVT